MELADDDLVRMYREGDADAFDALFDRYHAPVFNFARMMLGGADGAEVVLQETFLAVARSAGSYRGDGRFRPWVMRITRNLCLNRLRAERTRRRILAEDGTVLDPPSKAPGPPELAESGERINDVRRHIADLPDRQREAIVLYAFEQMPYREIAATLEVPLGTVKTLIHRARAALARALEETP